MRRFVLLLTMLAPLGWAQTVVNVSNTVQQANVYRPGIDISFLGFYGATQIYKNLLFANGGDFTGYYSRTSFTCSSGGTQTTTNWYNNNPDGVGFAANFWQAASNVAYNGSTGATLGSGTISASTSNVSAGINFTLGTSLPTACDTTHPDVLVVRQDSPPIPTPAQYLQGVSLSGTNSFDATDLPAGTTGWSLTLNTGASAIFNADAVLSNKTNTNPTLAAQQVNFIDINGSYTLSFLYKCSAASGTATITYQVQRLGGTNFVPAATVTPTCNPTAGAGWQTFTTTFTGSETGAQQGNLQVSLAAAGNTVKLKYVRLTEGSTLSPANNSVYRDAVVRKLRALKPGMLRFMDPSWWCSNAAAMESTEPAFCSVNSYGPFIHIYGTQNFHDALGLCVAVGTQACYLSVGQFWTTAEWTALPAWMAADSNYIAFKATGGQVFLAHGNEAFNSAAGGALYEGDGVVYGSIIGPDFAAFRGSASYDSAHMKLVAGNWFASNQSNPSGSFGWAYNVHHNASLTLNGQADYSELAAYNFGLLGNVTYSGGNVPTTGEPWSGMMAEIANFDSASSTPSGYRSMKASVAYLAAHFPTVQPMVYEYNSGLLSGIAANQLQLDQIAASVGEGLAMNEHYNLMARDSGVTGPMGGFDLSGAYNTYNCNIGSGCTSGVVVPIWHMERNMHCGPGELSTCTDPDTPQSIAQQVVSNAIGSNTNLLTVTQSNTPTYSYPGGQSNGTSNTIAANSAVNQVNAFAYSDGGSNYTLLLYNVDPGASHAVTITGAGAPTGSVTQVLYPNAGNVITDHNENSFVGTGSLSPVVTLPTSTSTSGTSYTICPGCFLALTYSNGGATPRVPSVGVIFVQ